MNNNKDNNTVIINDKETETKEIKLNEVSDRNRNDKRYEEPFENDGAYADDDID